MTTVDLGWPQLVAWRLPCRLPLVEDKVEAGRLGLLRDSEQDFGDAETSLEELGVYW